MLYGRDLEERRISTLVSDGRRGQSAALGIVAEPGAGKTALLDRATQLADGTWRVLRCAGVEGDSELPFSGLRELLVPHYLDQNLLEALPPTQADALRTALGLIGAARPTDRFLVGLATLSFLAELAEAEPVLCLIDDVQWLDSASAEALRFTARRLGAEGVVLLFASRSDDSLRGIPKIHLPPIGHRHVQSTADRILARSRSRDAHARAAGSRGKPVGAAGTSAHGSRCAAHRAAPAAAPLVEWVSAADR
ncbi:ATP-binding protein [Nocardia seriolae]|uniref:ATP-binding protein n=1 Tax=Nocardia seriolae TaxID=37332 RepID=UPI0004AE231E|nr:ATP-binding protein [Nocardia seriolae]MTJ90413.1 AAA family ATPase [Nocardia seriolae]MTK34374.1 AAA family ATPase [Nocardia seriolae]MTK43522.1 AAA family ATPase [Nocardia seriolae]PSK29430.1 ATP-binding protein [Nocardia seriolae]QOW33644.1 ATP-binding protein [Nocardia seriolae]